MTTLAGALGTMLLLWQIGHTPPVVDPGGMGTFSAPYGALEGGWVAADLALSADGRVERVTTLFAQSPFAASVTGPVAGWTFQPAADDGAATPARVSVTTFFRQGALYTPDGPARWLDPDKLDPENRPALPLTVAAPGYPAHSIAEGTVILELKIDEAGRAGEVGVVQGVDSLTDLALEAVHAWTFAPARWDGQPAPGLAIAIMYFQRPVLAGVN